MFVYEYKNRLVQYYEQIKRESERCIAHNKKVFCLVSQFETFLHDFKPKENEKSTYAHQDSLRQMASITKDTIEFLHSLREEVWYIDVLKYQIDHVPTTLCQFSSRANSATIDVSPVASQHFDSTSPMWVKLHILDLKNINKSLSHYLKTPNPDPSIVSLIEKKMQEIGKFITENEGKEDTSDIIFSVLPINFRKNRLVRSDVKRGPKIGEGYYSIVYKGIMNSTQEPVAIKELRAKHLDEKDLKTYQRELAIISSCNYSCLLKFIGATDSYPYWIVSELLPGNSLFNDIRSKSIGPTDRVIAAFDIARGMKYLHSRHIIHRDLKSLNVLLDDKKRIRICDFGLSKAVDDETAIMTNNLGTPHWMAPELFQGNYDDKIDVYSYGIVLWEIAMMKQPYDNMKASVITLQVSSGRLRPPLVPNGYSEEYKKLMVDCWQQNPSDRPNFIQILKRFQTEDIFIEGADREYIKSYIFQALSSEANERDKKFAELIKDCSTPQKIDEFIDFIEVNNIPDDRFNESVEFILSLAKDNQEKYIKGLVVLVLIRPDEKFTSYLRQFRNIPEKYVFKLAKLLPSGKENIDEDIVMIACKNGFPLLVLFKVVHNNHINAILETICRIGIKENIPDVYDYCSRALLNENLVPSALRCIMSINMMEKLEYSKLKRFVDSQDERISSIAKICLAEYATKRSNIPDYDILEYLKTCSHDPVSLLIVMSLCCNPKHARIIHEFLKESSFYKIGKPVRRKIEAQIRKSIPL